MAQDVTARPGSEEAGTETYRKPPLPKFMYKVVNPAMKAILRSPLHRLISNDLMVLIYEGRKSGKRFMIPVGYLQQGNSLYLFSHSPWWKNFRGGAPVGVRLRGELRRGVATVIEDPAKIAEIVRMLVEKRGEAMAKRMGMIAEERDAAGQPVPVPGGAVYIEIALENGQR
jgi:hypothetical protein